MTSLANLRGGEVAEVVTVEAHGILQRRLLDLGFVPGTPVELDQRAPFGDLRAYRIRGSVFALRDSESRRVKIRRLTAGGEERR